MDVFALSMAGPCCRSCRTETVMIDATYLKAHRTANSLGVKKGRTGGGSAARKAV